MDSKNDSKLGLVSGVYIPVCLNIMSILMFLRFGLVLDQVGFVGILVLLITAYCVDLLTTLSLSAIASNGEVKGGGAYYLISRSLGPEFGGSIGILFFLAQTLNTAMNIVGLLDCIQLNVGPTFPRGYWTVYSLQTAALVLCTGTCLLGPATFSKASNLLLVVLAVAVISIPVSAALKAPFTDEDTGIVYTGIDLNTFMGNLLPIFDNGTYHGLATFRDLFGILFPATSGIFAGASMSGDLRNPSKAIPKGILWGLLTTFIVYFIVILSMACTTSRGSFLANTNILSLTNLSASVVLAGECAVTLFSALICLRGSAKLVQALARDELLPGLSIFGRGTKKNDEPILAILFAHAIAQAALLADLNQIATFISMGYQVTFFVMNLACFLLKIGSAPNFRPSFKFFSWQTACIGSLLSAAAMFFVDETYAVIAICALVLIFLLIHYLCPPKRWGDVSQNLIYHQVRKYLLRLKPEHIKFWRPHIILLVNDPRRQNRLIKFCNYLKKGSLYILGHVIVTDDFTTGVHEARLQQQAWARYISEFSKIKAFSQLNMSPSITWGVRNLVLSAGLGGMRPNIAVLGFYNMEDLRRSNPYIPVSENSASTTSKMRCRLQQQDKFLLRRRRGDTSARLLEAVLPTDAIRREDMMAPTDYMVILEDLALRYKLNVAVAHGFENLEMPRDDETNTKSYVDLWPIQMSAEVSADGQNVLTTNFDTYTLILQLGHILHSVRAWKNVFTIRVIVFVEYEHEVDEECARVKVLLEKLRIDAHVVVLYLAAGDLDTYELIINNKSNNLDAEFAVAEALKNEEWWADLQTFRRKAHDPSSSREHTYLTQMLDFTDSGGYNPHESFIKARRRQSMPEVTEMPRRPDIATLSKLGVSVGIHTTHISEKVLQDPESDSDIETSTDDSFEVETESSAYGTIGSPIRQPKIPSKQALLHRGPGVLNKERHGEASFTNSRRRRRNIIETAQEIPPYGTMSTMHTLIAGSDVPATNCVSAVAVIGAIPPSQTTMDRKKDTEKFPEFEALPVLGFPSNGSRRARSVSPSGEGRLTPRDDTMTPVRPGFSRQSSVARFSSRLVPETKITTEGEGSKISFAPYSPNPITPRVERPAFSRQSSLGMFSNRPLLETKISSEEEESSRLNVSPRQTVSHSHSGPLSRHHSRQNSQYSTLWPDGVDQAIYEGMDSVQEHFAKGDRDGDDSASDFSHHAVSLSFNDLPSRAQHLVLNELMQKHSRETAVILTTLPIPSEGTSLDEISTIQYLSDVELLCSDLPPTLLVLSNNMTVTVDL